MKPLSAYPQPIQNTGIGLHDAEDKYWRPANLADFVALLRAYGVTWYKLLVGDAGKADIAYALKQAGIEPIVRIMYGNSRPNPGNAWLTSEMARIAGAYTSKGVSYFELSNEPNLQCEWDNDTIPSNAPGLLAEQYIRSAHAIEQRGGICLVPALAPGGNWPHADFYRTFMEEMRLRNGWAEIEWPAFAIHNYGMGHPPDYPFDAVNQAEHPGATLEDDSVGFLMFQWLDDLIVHYLGGHVPLLSTEGGYTFQDSGDRRYSNPPQYNVPYSGPPLWYNQLTPERHAEVNMELFQGFQGAFPRWPYWLFCACYWKGFSSRAEGHTDTWQIDTLFDNPVFGGDLPLERRLREIADGNSGGGNTDSEPFTSPGTGAQPPPPSSAEGGNMEFKFLEAFLAPAQRLGVGITGKPVMPIRNIPLGKDAPMDVYERHLTFQLTEKGIMLYTEGMGEGFFIPAAVPPNL